MSEKEKQQGQLKFLILSHEGAFLTIAKKLIDEGNDVLVGQVTKDKNLLTREELKKPFKENPKEIELRKTIYEGIIPKITAEKLTKKAETLPRDYLVFTDSNDMFRYTTHLAKKGFTGLMAREEDRIYEVQREKGKEFVKKHYAGIKISEAHSFKTIEDGIKFLEGVEQIFVLKSLGDAGTTVVPKNNDVNSSKELIVNTLQKEKKDYEQNGFLLEQKIIDGIEITPQIVFWDGKPVYTSVDIEVKGIGAGELGPQVGCAFNLIIKTDLEDSINKLAFPKKIYELASQRKGMFIWDCGLLFDEKTGDPYFTEFCSQRLGWDSFPTEIAMSGEPDGSKIATPYFDSLIKGNDPLKTRFGAAVRLFNVDLNSKKGIGGKDLLISWDYEADPDVFMYYIKKKDGKLATVGEYIDLGVVTGVGDTIEEAVDRCYMYVNMVNFKDMMYRTKEDILSLSYPQAVLRRLEYLVKRGFIKDEGILKEVEELKNKKIIYEPSESSTQDNSEGYTA